MLNLEKKVEEVLGGKIRILRFNVAEQSGSSLPADRFLWTGILLAEAELAEFEHGRLREGACASAGGTPPPCRFLDSISQALPSTLDELASELGVFSDRGQESIVCDSGDGFVTKLRLMKPSIHTGSLAPLANTRALRFIDPRITLNDPQGPATCVSRFGKRREAMPGQIF